IIFKSPRNRLDRWHLGAIERGTHIEQSLDWHDGLIISMGYIQNNNIYMFTEREFFIYSILQRRKLNSRMLPHGNDDGYEIINFLVQMDDLSYGVVFCSTNDCSKNDSISSIILIGAKQPLTISSAYIHSLKRDIFFINDPSIDILHIITIEKYLQSYSITAH